MQNEVAQIRHERQPRVPDLHVVCHHEHLGEKPVDGRAKAGDIDECRAVVASRRRGLDARPAQVELLDERTLGGLDDRGAVERRIVATLCCLT
jgi:hypothetical protein